MDSFDSKLAHTNTHWWITSLAISVICCSILFVVFASYLFQIKEDLAVATVRFDLTESRLNALSTELQVLKQRSNVQQIQIVPSAAPAQLNTPTSSIPAPEQPNVLPTPVVPAVPSAPAPN